MDLHEVEGGAIKETVPLTLPALLEGSSPKQRLRLQAKRTADGKGHGDAAATDFEPAPYLPAGSPEEAVARRAQRKTCLG